VISRTMLAVLSSANSICLWKISTQKVTATLTGTAAFNLL
jgi:hypothetical protein